MAQSAFLGRCSPVRVVRIEPYGKDSRLAILTDGTRLLVSRAGYARLAILTDGTRLLVSRAGYARLKSLLDERK